MLLCGPIGGAAISFGIPYPFILFVAKNRMFFS